MFSSPHCASMMYSGITSRMPGIMRTTSATTRAELFSPNRRLKRVSEKAARVPSTRLTVTEKITMMMLFSRYAAKWYVLNRRL